MQYYVRKIGFLFVILVLLLRCFSSILAEEDNILNLLFKEKERIIFLYLEDVSDKTKPNIVRKIYDTIAHQIKMIPDFSYVEKDYFETYLKENKLTPLLDFITLLDTTTLAKLGRLIKADKILWGEITIYDEEMSRRKAEVCLQVNFQLFDVQEEKVVKNFMVFGKSKLSGRKKGNEARKIAYGSVASSLQRKLEGKELKIESKEEYIGNKKSKIFHLSNSHHLPSPENQIVFSSLAAAKEAGYKPCLVCFPLFSPSTKAADSLELALGQEIAGIIEYYYRILYNEEKTAEVSKVGEKIAQVTERQRLRYIFTILNTDEINAFAAAAGFIYITKGMLDIIESEDELASVLSHEIAHITKKHAVRQYRRASNLAFLGAVLSAGAGVDNIVVDFAQALVLNGYDRKYEREADELALIYMLKAGYNPEEYIKLLYKLKDLEKTEPSKLEVYFRSHPPTEDRIKRCKEFLKRYRKLLIIVDDLLKKEEKRRKIEKLIEQLSATSLQIRKKVLY